MIQKQGSKIILRDWLTQDLEIYKTWLEPQHEWHNLNGPYYRLTTEEAEKTIALLKKKLTENSFPLPRKRLVVADAQTNILIGTVSSYWESIETNWLCAGIIFYDPQIWGKGFGIEALGLWIDYLFESYPQIVRLDMRTWSGNIGMMKLAIKLGFTQEACFRNARIVNGKYFDSLGYGILREEWAAFPKSRL